MTMQPEQIPEKTHAEELQEEIFSTDLEIEGVRRKVERAQEVAELALLKLHRRRWTLVRALSNERERGAGWTATNGRVGDERTGEVRS